MTDYVDTREMIGQLHQGGAIRAILSFANDRYEEYESTVSDSRSHQAEKQIQFKLEKDLSQSPQGVKCLMCECKKIMIAREDFLLEHQTRFVGEVYCSQSRCIKVRLL